MISFRQANRMIEAPLSGIREVVSYANKLSQLGKEIIHLEIGEPDFDTPKQIKEGAKSALDEGKVHYPPLVGIDELRKALSEKFNKENGLNYAPEEIIITNGVSQGIFAAIMAFINDGDEILIPDPGFLNYMYVPKIAGGIIKTYSLKEENGFQPDVEEIRSLITNKTKMIALISPNNPTGSILKIESLKGIAELVIANNLLVVSDEVYERIIYDENVHISIASLPGMKERTIVLNGFSKYFAMTGWRLGYIAAPTPLIDPMMRLCFYNSTSANSFAQWGALEALLRDNSPSEDMVCEYKRRRDYLFTSLNNIEKLSCALPDGAFYMFLNIKEIGLTSQEFTKYILEEAGVATVPGIVFGKTGEGYVRLSYANSYENIVKAVERIKEAVAKLSDNRSHTLLIYKG